MTKKELWPGAGFYLDFANITDEDFDKVERRLNKIGDTRAKILFLETLWQYYLVAVGEITATFRDLERNRYPSDGKHLTAEQSYRRAKAAYEEFIDRGNRFEARFKRRLKLLNEVLKIEAKAAASKPAEEPASEPEAAKLIASRELGEVKALTAAQRVWVFYFLLQEAGLNEDVFTDKGLRAEIARFIVAVTGSEPSKVYDHVRKPEQETEKGTRKDLAAARSWFERLGLADVVKKIDQQKKNLGG